MKKMKQMALAVLLMPLLFACSGGSSTDTNIIRKTKRFAISERAVYFLKTKRTAGGTPPPQNIFDRLTPVFT